MRFTSTSLDWHLSLKNILWVSFIFNFTKAPDNCVLLSDNGLIMLSAFKNIVLPYTVWALKESSSFYPSRKSYHYVNMRKIKGLYGEGGGREMVLFNHLKCHKKLNWRSWKLRRQTISVLLPRKLVYIHEISRKSSEHMFRKFTVLKMKYCILLISFLCWLVLFLHFRLWGRIILNQKEY